MKKTVYSLVLSKEIIDKVDERAYRERKSRSQMINQILAQSVGVSTPEHYLQEILSALSQEINSYANTLFPMVSSSQSMFCIRSAVPYKYNPSMQYTVEFYKKSAQTWGVFRASMRTQNTILCAMLEEFYQFWNTLEQTTAQQTGHCEIQGIKYTRYLKPCTPFSCAQEAAKAVMDYVLLFDTCLKAYFQNEQPQFIAKFYQEKFSNQKYQFE